MTDEPLPSFRRPPVVETVLGVQFEPLPTFTNAHLGAFWKTLSREWESAADAVALPQEIERFDEDRTWQTIGSFKLGFTSKPSTRVQIRNAQNNRMVQLQNGRLHYNWMAGDVEGYPRYGTIRPGFNGMLERLRCFLTEEGIGELRPNQWEVTYVNHLPRGPIWQAPSDWFKLFNWKAVFTAACEGVPLESIGGGDWHYVISPRRGRLHVTMNHGRNDGPTGDEVLMLTLTARGGIGDRDTDSSIDEGLNLGHSVIVKSFASLTSDEAQRHWERYE